MPTETQHLEQRVAALQSDLDAPDQVLDDATTENNERELSRRDWFEAAQAAEKRVEVLGAQLAERDALLREILGCQEASYLHTKIRTALSASADPSAPKCETCQGVGEVYSGKMADQGWHQPPEPIMDECPDCKWGAPVERDERADFDLAFPGLVRNEDGSLLYVEDRNKWYGWQARAALDKATEGASHA